MKTPRLEETTTRKLLQNTLFAAMTAWALYAAQSHAVADMPSTAAPLADIR